MSIRNTLRRSRTLAGELMTDTADVRRPGPLVLDDTSGELAPAAAGLVYLGPCRVRVAGDQNEGRIVFGERLVTTVRNAVWFPWDAPAIEVDDIITVTSCSDPGLEGRAMRVLSVGAKSHPHFREVSVQFDD